MDQLKLPQISRKINAGLWPLAVRIGIWSVLISVVALNIEARSSGSFKSLPNWYRQIAPKSLPHLLLSAWSPSDSNVLGVSTPSPQELNAQQRNHLENEYKFWQTIVGIKPDYRDGYIWLAGLSYQLNLPQQTSAYLQKARELDPNAALLQKFLPLVKNSGE